MKKECNLFLWMVVWLPSYFYNHIRKSQMILMHFIWHFRQKIPFGRKNVGWWNANVISVTLSHRPQPDIYLNHLIWKSRSNILDFKYFVYYLHFSLTKVFPKVSLPHQVLHTVPQIIEENFVIRWVVRVNIH